MDYKEVAEKCRLALNISRNMIIDFENKLETAIENENWDRVARLSSYIDGMNQIIANFELAVGDGK